MLFLIAGVPSPHFQVFKKRASKIFGTANTHIARPLIGDQQRQYKLRKSDGTALLNNLKNRLEREPNLLDNGVGLLYLCHQWDDVTNFLNLFFPFSATRRINLPFPLHTNAPGGDITANQILKSLRGSVPRMVKAAKSMKTEITSRQNRTPLLLPIKKFSSNTLDHELRKLFEGLAEGNQPHDMISNSCDNIETHHPFERRRSGRSPCFINSTGVRFSMPGRALHSRSHLDDEEYFVSCYLNGRMRLGASFNEGFHYDCTRNGRLSGRFPNCRGLYANYVGNPHLNIAPNDHIRGKQGPLNEGPNL